MKKIIFTLMTSALLSISLFAKEPVLIKNSPSITLTQEMDAPAALYHGSLYVPASFFAQSYDYLVQTLDEQVFIATENPNKIDDDIIMSLNEGTNSYYVNQTVGISLEENPSTGYMWQVNFPTHIKIVSDNFSVGNTQLVGAPGTHHWLLKATKQGTYNITFSKIRQGDTAPIETKTFILEAKEFVIPK